MRSLIAFLLCLSCLSLLTGTGYAQGDIISFYPRAFGRTQTPPDRAVLRVARQVQIHDRYVTFVGVDPLLGAIVGLDPHKVLLAAITPKPLLNPNQTLYLKTVFNPMPTAGPVQDWGYVFDRNGDGKIDYVAWLVGAGPVKQKDFPANYPKRGQRLTLDQLGVALESSRLIFEHWADDNFEGRLSGIVFEAADPERDWVEGWTVVRSSHFDGVLDECWHFRESIETRMVACEHSGDGYRTRRLRIFGNTFGRNDLAKKSDILRMLNDAAQMGGLTSDSFYQE